MHWTPVYAKGRDSPVGITTRYEVDGPEIESRWRARFSAPVQTGPAAHPTSYTMGKAAVCVSAEFRITVNNVNKLRDARQKQYPTMSALDVCQASFRQQQ
jgi:hypothetical protein